MNQERPVVACSVGGCTEPCLVIKRGLCSIHYQRWRTHGRTHKHRSTVPVIPCPYCALPFRAIMVKAGNGKWQRKKFCSHDCFCKARPWKVCFVKCKRCAKPFQALRRPPGRQQFLVKFCSVECRTAPQWAPTPKQCLHCLSLFIPNHATQKCCSQLCGVKRPNSKKYQLLSCVICSQEFNRRARGGDKSLFCSRLCSHVWQAYSLPFLTSEMKLDSQFMDSRRRIIRLYALAREHNYKENHYGRNKEAKM